MPAVAGRGGTARDEAEADQAAHGAQEEALKLPPPTFMYGYRFSRGIHARKAVKSGSSFFSARTCSE